jgi:hypothetical protein
MVSKWISAVFNSSNIRCSGKEFLCSNHFLSDDYMAVSGTRKKLRTTAVPSIFTKMPSGGKLLQHNKTRNLVVCCRRREYRLKMKVQVLLRRKLKEEKEALLRKLDQLKSKLKMDLLGFFYFTILLYLFCFLHFS